MEDDALFADAMSAGEQPPTRQMLAEAIWRHQEEARIRATARSRVGTSLPTETEIESVRRSRRDAETRRRTAQLQDDVQRTGVTALRCYDTLLDQDDKDTLEPAAPMSDVPVRQDLVRPLHKLVAILALRQRLANVLRSVAAARAMRDVHAESAERGLAGVDGGDGVGGGGHLPLPAVAALPPLTTLLRQLPLPDVAVRNAVPSSAEERPAAHERLFDVPRSRPLHEPFVFRLRHCTPVGMPPFVLDIAAVADRELQSSTTERPPGSEVEVPEMDAPELTDEAHFMPAADVFNGGGDVGARSALTSSLTHVAVDPRQTRALRAGPAGVGVADEAQADAAVLPSKSRSGYATGLMHPQSR